MKVVVKTLDSKNQELEVPGECSVRQLKEKIAQEMNIPIEKQRLIFQGKVLKEGKLLRDYGDLDGKVIHLVQSAPPPEAMQTEATGSSSTSSPSTNTNPVTATPIPPHTRSDVLFVSTMPVLPGSDIAQMTQHLVSNIVDSLTASGQHASVSAHAQMVDATTGRTHEHVVASATTGGMTPNGTAPGVPQGMEGRQQTGEQAEQERSRRQLREIYQNMRSARRCLNYAKTVLDNYESGTETAAGAAAQVESRGVGSLGARAVPSSSATVNGATLEEPAGVSDLQPVGANLYADLLEEQDSLCSRIGSLTRQYVQLIRQDSVIPTSNVAHVQRLAQAIKDLNYYMGHVQLALSRLHVCMNSQVPRVVRLVPPRRSELQRAMHHLRSFTVPPPELLFDLARSQLGRGPNGGRDQGSTAGPQQQGAAQPPSGDPSTRPIQTIRLGPISFGATFSMPNPQGEPTSTSEGPGVSRSASGQSNISGGSHADEQTSQPVGQNTQANGTYHAHQDIGQLLSNIIGNFMQVHSDIHVGAGNQADGAGGAPGGAGGAPGGAGGAPGAQQQATNVGASTAHGTPQTSSTSAPQGATGVNLGGHGQMGRGSDITINFPLVPTFQVLSNLLQQGPAQVSPGQSTSSPGQSATSTGQLPFSQPLLSMSGSGEEDTEMEEDGYDFQLEFDTPTVDPPADLGDPMARLTNAALEDMLTGSRQTIADIIHGLREEIGMEMEDAGDMTMVEHLLQIISSEMSVYDVMSVFRGNVEPLRNIQPSLRTFLRDHILRGVEPTEEHCERAVEVFLQGVVPSLEPLQGLPLCVENIDFPRTIHRVLSTIMSDVYRRVIANYTGGGGGFPEAMRTWVTSSTALFGALLRHITGSEESYEIVARQLLGLLFPPSTPQPILASCSASVLNEMRRLRDVVCHTPQELDSYVVRCHGGSGVPGLSSPSPPGPSSSHTCGTTLLESAPMASSQPSLPKTPEEHHLEYPPTIPQEWIPVINADREVMGQMEPQKPYSDAYASAMPMKKRKMENGKAEVSTLKELLTSSVEKAVQQTGATPTSGASLDAILQEVRDNKELLDNMGIEMHGAMQERLEKDPDFSPQKFPQAQKMYNIRK